VNNDSYVIMSQVIQIVKVKPAIVCHIVQVLIAPAILPKLYQPRAGVQDGQAEKS